MATQERRKYDEEFIDRLARIETHIGNISDHLKGINGSIADYQSTKNKVETACIKLTELDADVNTMEKLVNNIKVKIWSVAAFVGVICGGIGSAVGLIINKFGGA